MTEQNPFSIERIAPSAANYLRRLIFALFILSIKMTEQFVLLLLTIAATYIDYVKFQ